MFRDAKRRNNFRRIARRYEKAIRKREKNDARVQNRAKERARLKRYVENYVQNYSNSENYIPSRARARELRPPRYAVTLDYLPFRRGVRSVLPGAIK